MQSKCPQEHSERKMFSFWSKPIFSRLRILTDAFLNIQRKLFCQFCQYGIQRIHRNDWMKFLSNKELELFYRFRTLNEKSPQLLPENIVTVVEIVLRCPGYVFRLNNFFEKCAIFLSFSYFDWFSFIFAWFFVGRVCKTALYVPDELFKENCLVWDFFFQFFNRFRIWAKHFRSHGDNCAAALSKVHFFGARNKIKEILFWKKL